MNASAEDDKSAGVKLKIEPETSSFRENIKLTDAAVMDIITNYCGHEAGVRNLKKAMDRVFRKIVAKIEN